MVTESACEIHGTALAVYANVSWFCLAACCAQFDRCDCYKAAWTAECAQYVCSTMSVCIICSVLVGYLPAVCTRHCSLTCYVDAPPCICQAWLSGNLALDRVLMCCRSSLRSYTASQCSSIAMQLQIGTCNSVNSHGICILQEDVRLHHPVQPLAAIRGDPG